MKVGVAILPLPASVILIVKKLNNIFLSRSVSHSVVSKLIIDTNMWLATRHYSVINASTRGVSKICHGLKNC